MAKDHDPDELSKDGIVSRRVLDYIATCLEQYLEVYEVVNNDPSITFEDREEACEKVRKVIKSLRKGKTKYLDKEKLQQFAPILEKEAMNAFEENDFGQATMGLNYAYTENKEYADFFLKTRSKKSIIMMERTADETYVNLFELNHKMEMLFKNVLTDGKSSFDFVTTYGEEFMIGNACERITDFLPEVIHNLSAIPFDVEIQNRISGIYGYLKACMKTEQPMGAFNTFSIFTNLFMDTLV